LISHPQPLLRAGLRAYLDTCDELKVVGWCAALSDVRGLCDQLSPDVVLVGHDMYHLQWDQLVRRHITDSYKVRALLLAPEGLKPERYSNAFKSGFRGIYLNESELQALRIGIGRVHDGQLWCDSRLSTNLLEFLLLPTEENRVNSAAQQILTERQERIANLVRRGHSNAEIASMLFTSQATVARELTAIYRVLEVADRTQLLVAAGQ
jgi:DNA-binding NarL/FixJ family response regulator